MTSESRPSHEIAPSSSHVVRPPLGKPYGQTHPYQEQCCEDGNADGDSVGTGRDSRSDQLIRETGAEHERAGDDEVAERPVDFIGELHRQ